MMLRGLQAGRHSGRPGARIVQRRAPIVSDTLHLPLTAQLTVVGYSDRPVDQGGFGPTELYPEICWLPIIGGSTLLLWKALNRRIPPVGAAATVVDTTDLVVGLGLGHGPRRTGAGARAVTA